MSAVACSFSCEASEKQHWERCVDLLGFSSFSAMVRYALHQLILSEVGSIPVRVFRRVNVDSEATQGE